tara:strand:+ start:4352 stop:4753 length:402 start_codon:yes stop_codon:yes gene_type:complete
MIFTKNISLGKTNTFLLIIFIFLLFPKESNSLEIPEKNYTGLKVLDKVSSKNITINLENGKEIIFEDLAIKSIRCKNSEFDDNPEITAYIQVKDLNNKTNNEVFVFNGWMFSSSPSINPFDHPVYDIWLIKCY